MAGSATNVFEIDVLKAVTGQATSILTTTPITPYLALYTVAPTDSSNGTEATGGGYARKNVSGLFSTPSSGSVANNVDVSFTTFTGPVSSLAPIVAWAMLDASSGGNMLYYTTLDNQTKTYDVDDTARFLSGTITITLD